MTKLLASTLSTNLDANAWEGANRASEMTSNMNGNRAASLPTLLADSRFLDQLDLIFNTFRNSYEDWICKIYLA
jgi:hypothetical protein